MRRGDHVTASPQALAWRGCHDRRTHRHPRPGRDRGAGQAAHPTGVDLNVVYGVSAAIVAPFCTEIDAGHRWTVTNAWFMSPTFDIVPAGFVPAGATPADDFIAKFEAMKYVVDPGPKEKSYVFTNVEALAIRGPLPPEGFFVANPITLGSMSPLKPGTHVVESYFVMSALHCDGLGDSVAGNCLQGVTLFSSIEFTVTPLNG